jgi:hypothetical protein
VGQLHEVRADDQVPSGWPLHRVTPFVLVALGAFIGALALAALFAHPAGASTLPGTSGAPTVPPVSNVVHPAAATVDALDALTDVVAPHRATPGPDSTTGPNAATGPVAGPVVGPVVTLLPEVTVLPVVTLWQVPSSALYGLAPVIEPVSQATVPLLGLVVTTPTSVPVSGLDTSLSSAPWAAASGVEPLTGTTTVPLGTTIRFPGGPAALGVPSGPGAPDPAPAPAWPLQSFPLAPCGSPTGDSSLSSAGTALVAAPASGLLLPDPPVSGVIPAQRGIPRLLFDLRSSPPG